MNIYEALRIAIDKALIAGGKCIHRATGGKMAKIIFTEQIKAPHIGSKVKILEENEDSVTIAKVDSNGNFTNDGFRILSTSSSIDTEEYLITDGQSLYGFIAGILASNHDVTDIFVDSALKICQEDAASFDYFINEIDALLKNHDVNCVMTASLPIDAASDTVKKFL